MAREVWALYAGVHGSDGIDIFPSEADALAAMIDLIGDGETPAPDPHDDPDEARDWIEEHVSGTWHLQDITEAVQ